MNEQMKFEKYKAYCNLCLIDLLLFSKNIEKDLENFRAVIVNPEFIETYRNIIKFIKESNPYPEETYENMKKIVEFIDKNSFGFIEFIEQCNDILNNMTEFNNERYLEEFTIKYDNLQDFKNNSCHMWNKDDMIESIRYDYLSSIFLSCDKEQFLINLDNFILNKKFIYSLKKIIDLCPDGLKIENHWYRALEILEFNINSTTEYDSEIISMYINKNYNSSIKEFNIEELDKFKQLNQEVYNKIRKFKFNKFNIEEFTNYYEILKLEDYLFFEGDINPEEIKIETIYSFIKENLEYPNITQKEIKKLQSILYLKRQDLTKEEIKKHCDYVMMLNQIKPVEYHFETGFNRMDRFDKIKIYITKNQKLLHEILGLQRYDLEHFEVLLSDNIDSIKENYKEICFYRSILRFINECPSMFASELIRNNAIEVLKVCEEKQSKKIIRKLEKR